MAVTERNFSGTEYREPTDSEYIYHPKADKAGLQVLEACGLRVCAIHEVMVTLEPVQEGVFRYPPVQVGVPRDPEFIDRYIHMGPSTFSEPSDT